MTISALIFDFDGLILDTESAIFEAWQEAYRGHGHELSLDLWQHSIGTYGGFDPFAHLGELVGPSFDEPALRRMVSLEERRRCEALELLPGVVELLLSARQAGLKLAIASSSPRDWVESWLERHHIRERFDLLCTGDEVAQVKPAPDLYLLAARRLGLPPADCLVFEDSPNGMLAAQRAGMRCVAVPNSVTRQLALPNPTLVLSSLGELPLDELMRRLGEALPGGAHG